jgi:hypothetical protein
MLTWADLFSLESVSGALQVQAVTQFHCELDITKAGQSMDSRAVTGTLNACGSSLYLIIGYPRGSPSYIHIHYYYYYYYYYYLFKLRMGFYSVAVVLQLDTTHKITHHTQTKHSTQNYTNNKGHTTHNEYNANTITTTINKTTIK